MVTHSTGNPSQPTGELAPIAFDVGDVANGEVFSYQVPTEQRSYDEDQEPDWFNDAEKEIKDRPLYSALERLLKAKAPKRGNWFRDFMWDGEPDTNSSDYYQVMGPTQGVMSGATGVNVGEFGHGQNEFRPDAKIPLPNHYGHSILPYKVHGDLDLAGHRKRVAASLAALIKEGAALSTGTPGANYAVVGDKPKKREDEEDSVTKADEDPLGQTEPTAPKAPTFQGATTSSLKDAGYDAYVVGGTARDYLLGRDPKDVDMTTNATPEQVTAAAESAGLKVHPTGIEHGTVTVVDPDYGPIEVTTYRTEGKYSDSRRPDEVEFVQNLDDDLGRRDLTINAIAMNPLTGELSDPWGGQQDLNSRLVRAVGDPVKRFTEDGLRPLRAARFASTLDFDIEPETLAAMKNPEVHDAFKQVSQERVSDEMLKALKRSEKPSNFFRILHDTGLLDNVLPELKDAVDVKQSSKWHEHDVFNHIMEVLDETPNDPALRLAALFHDIAKPATITYDEDGVPHFYGHEDEGAEMAQEAMKRLKMPNDLIQKVTNLVRHHMWHYKPEMRDSTVRRFIESLGPENLQDYAALRRADIAGHGRPQHAEGHLDNLNQFLARVKELEEKGGATTPKPVVNGNDVMEMGVPAGPGVGRVLEALKDIIAEDPGRNTREELLPIAEQLAEKENREKKVLGFLIKALKKKEEDLPGAPPPLNTKSPPSTDWGTDELGSFHILNDPNKPGKSPESTPSFTSVMNQINEAAGKGVPEDIPSGEPSANEVLAGLKNSWGWTDEDYDYPTDYGEDSEDYGNTGWNYSPPNPPPYKPDPSWGNLNVPDAVNPLKAERFEPLKGYLDNNPGEEGINYRIMSVGYLPSGDTMFIKPYNADSYFRHGGKAAMDAYRVAKTMGIFVPEHAFNEEESTLVTQGIKATSAEDVSFTDGYWDGASNSFYNTVYKSAIEFAAFCIIADVGDMHGGNLVVMEDGTVTSYDLEAEGYKRLNPGQKLFSALQQLLIRQGLSPAGRRYFRDILKENVDDAVKRMARNINYDKLMASGMSQDRCREISRRATEAMDEGWEWIY